MWNSIIQNLKDDRDITITDSFYSYCNVNDIDEANAIINMIKKISPDSPLLPSYCTSKLSDLQMKNLLKKYDMTDDDIISMYNKALNYNSYRNLAKSGPPKLVNNTKGGYNLEKMFIKVNLVLSRDKIPWYKEKKERSSRRKSKIVLDNNGNTKKLKTKLYSSWYITWFS